MRPGPVLGVVRGSAVNQDGRSQGLTAPNGPAQRRVIEDALAAASLTPADIDVVEAHGTGTPLGDPIEAQALLEVYGRTRTEDHPLWLGSVKSNVAHTQAAAGAAGILKLLLALKASTLPRSLFAENPSRKVEWLPTIRLLDAARPWPVEAGRLRRGAVSAFGIGGTNAHVVIEEPPAIRHSTRSPVPVAVPICLSARTESALRTLATQVADRISAEPPGTVADIAVTLARHRIPLIVPAGFAATDLGDLERRLRTLPPPRVGSQGEVGVLFSGQGSQVVGMGRELAAASPGFRTALEQVCAALDPHLPRPLLDVMHAPAGSVAAEELDRTRWTQPALFAIEVALYRLWESLGLRPAVLLGHSVGEIAAAACLRGVVARRRRAPDRHPRTADGRPPRGG